MLNRETRIEPLSIVKDAQTEVRITDQLIMRIYGAGLKPTQYYALSFLQKKNELNLSQRSISVTSCG